MPPLLTELHAATRPYFAAPVDRWRRPAARMERTLLIACCEMGTAVDQISSLDSSTTLIVQNLGNVVPRYTRRQSGSTSASIESALHSHGASDIVVCGHDPCCAVQGALDSGGQRPRPRYMDAAASCATVGAFVWKHYGQLDPVSLRSVAAREHVLLQLENLLTYPSIAARVAVGMLRLHAWVRRRDMARLQVFNPSSGQFE